MKRWLRISLFLVLGFLLLAVSSARAGEPPSSAFRVISVGEGTLVFTRLRANGRDSEGVVIDSDKLLSQLKARVLQANGLDEVADLSSLGSRSSRGSLPSQREGYSFSQGFAAPFESMSASLNLRPLADPEDGALILPLSIVLGLALVLGLFALYRMAATQVRFAERRNNFVSAVSHELKTPLTAIRMHAEMLEEDLVDGDAKRHEYYRTITRESERLTRLIDNVLALSQIEKGTRRLALLVGDIRQCVQESVDMLRPHVEAQGFVLELDADPYLPDVRFEPDALKQVLFNLVDNALKYGRDGSDRRISIRCQPAGQGVVVSVRDRGPGVQREHLKSIFEPFFRAEQELTRKNQGTGLGLSLVKGLADAMGASLHGENSDPGFSVRLVLPSHQS